MAQTLQAIFHQGNQRRLDHTPSVAVIAGEIRDLGDIIGVCTSPEGIAAGVLGAMDIDGMYKFKKATAGPVFAVGDIISWDDTNNTCVIKGSPLESWDLGVCTEAAATGDVYVRGWLNKQAIN